MRCCAAIILVVLLIGWLVSGSNNLSEFVGHTGLILMIGGTLVVIGNGIYTSIKMKANPAIWPITVIIAGLISQPLGGIGMASLIIGVILMHFGNG